MARRNQKYVPQPPPQPAPPVAATEPEGDNENVAKAGRPIRAAVLRYLDTHAGERVYADRMAAELGETVTRVSGAMANLRSDGYEAIRVATGIWDLPDDPHAKAQAFVVIGKTQEGDMILQGKDGILYRAVQL